MDLKNTLAETLEERFLGEESIDEMKDICQYGMSGGFSDFIYYSETSEFFDEFEEEIIDMLEEMDVTLAEVMERSNNNMNSFKQLAVWMIVESFCFMKLD